MLGLIILTGLMQPCPLPRRRHQSRNFQRFVAQVSNLLYRRLPVGRPVTCPSGWPFPQSAGWKPAIKVAAPLRGARWGLAGSESQPHLRRLETDKGSRASPRRSLGTGRLGKPTPPPQVGNLRHSRLEVCATKLRRTELDAALPFARPKGRQDQFMSKKSRRPRSDFPRRRPLPA